MKHFFLALLFFVAFLSKGFSQDSIPPIDKSPMDISYFPEDYPLLKTQHKTNDALIARVIYSRPYMNGRMIFGGLVESGQVWRLGANESTEIEFFRNVRLANKPVAKGRYTLYAIPFKDKWTIILNRDLNVWGAFAYNSKMDVLRVDVPVHPLTDPVENFSLFFKPSVGQQFYLCAEWEKTKVIVPFSY